MPDRVDTTDPPMHTAPAMTQDPCEPPAKSTSEPESGRAAKLPYVPPRVEQRVPIVTNTLQSGSECVFDSPPCPD
jgi:hypothetical protein